MADGFAAVCSCLADESLDDETKAELDCAGREEDDIDGKGGEEDLVGHFEKAASSRVN